LWRQRHATRAAANVFHLDTIHARPSRFTVLSMTIVSHTHQFIFKKTMKTAGTAIELALAPLLAPDDLLSSGRLLQTAGFPNQRHHKSLRATLRSLHLSIPLHNFLEDLHYHGPFRLRRL
jgi:hypothetical protein